MFSAPRPELIYSRPPWRDLIEGPAARRPRPRPRPRVRWRGNVAHVETRAEGFRLVETASGWRLAWWQPWRAKSRRCQPFSEAGTYQEACAALQWLREHDARPVYPPLPMGAR